MIEESILSRKNQEVGERAKDLLKDLWSLSKEEEEDLKERVVRSRGSVRIVIHPYFIEQYNNSEYQNRIQDPKQRIDIVEEGLEKILKVDSDIPVFLFEGHVQIPSTTEKISSFLNGNKNTVYIVPTYPNYSTPYIKDGVSGSWKQLIMRFKSLGVTKMVIGGTYLEILPRSDKKYEQLINCVGTAINVLQSDFDVQISNMAHPRSRKDSELPDRKAANK